MLIVPARELGNPVRFFVLMKADNELLHAALIAVRFKSRRRGTRE